ncbi:MAG: alpha/beta hydrolase [Myxococcota bacterium]
MQPFRDHSIPLRDGRQIAVAEFGDPAGRTVFWFHGTPGGRWQLPPEAPGLARQLGLRLIGVDRPGTGGSSHDSRRTLLSWADDIAQCADAIGAPRFAAVGLSGGGPYVLACAHQLAQRMVVGVSLGGLGPTAGTDRAPGLPALVTGLGRAVGTARRPLGSALSALSRPLSPLLPSFYDLYARLSWRVDRGVLRRPDMRSIFTADLAVATGNGLRGMVHDLSLFTRPWPFSPREVQVPIRLWHGGADPIVPVAHAHYLAEILPNSELFILAGQGHYAGFVQTSDVLSDLAEVWSRREGSVASAHETASEGE